MNKDYYKILGIPKTASDDEIKQAYRKLAHAHHPDKKGGDTQKFKEINEAYQILSDKAKRASYDRYGSAEPFAAGAPPHWGGFGGQGVNWDSQFYGDYGDLSEIFDSFFEGLGVKPKKKTYHRGSDLEAALEISLEETFRGTTKNLKINTYLRCDQCGGKGADLSAGVTACATCGGQGEIREQSRTFFGSFYQNKICKQCHGLGQIPNQVCLSCKGSGRRTATREINVDIRPGIEGNQIIQIKGAGEAGERGGTEGDLYIRIKIQPHPLFTREGDNLKTKKEIKIVDLLLGKKVDIPTLSGGKINLEIPAHFDLTQELRIKGEGMPHFGGSFRGDLLVHFIVKAPKKPNTRAKKILEDLEKELE